MILVLKNPNILKHDYIYIVTNSIKNDIQKGKISITVAPAKVAKAKLTTFFFKSSALFGNDFMPDA